MEVEAEVLGREVQRVFLREMWVSEGRRTSPSSRVGLLQGVSGWHCQRWCYEEFANKRVIEMGVETYRSEL